MSDLIYYNLNLTNTTDYPLPVEITDSRSSPVLENPSEYEMSIVRFQIDASGLPIFNPIIPDPTFPNRTNMSITLGYNGIYSQQYIEVSNLELKGVYSYNVFLDNINYAFAQAFLGIADPGIVATNAPKLYLDSETSLISMYVQSDYLKSNPNHISIFFNRELMSKLNFPYNNFNGVTAPLGRAYEIEVKSYVELIPPVGSRFGYPFNVVNIPGDVLKLSQEFTSLNSWSDIKSLLFTTNSIPITNEFASVVFDPSQNFSSSRASLPIVTDFDINQNGPPGSNVRGIIQYVPSEYRMKSLISTTPFNTINIAIYWQDFLGGVHPVNILTNTSVSIKIMFRKKK